MNPDYRQGQQLNPGNPQNEASVRTMRTYNTFPMSYKHGLTARFGDVTPFYVFEAESGDKVPFGSFHEVISPTLAGLSMSDIRMIKDYFSVPMRSIMPNTWDLFYVPPTQGDDVPDDVAPTIPFTNIFRVLYNEFFDLWKAPLDLRQSFIESLNITSDNKIGHLWTWMWRSYYLNECFYDSGSLLSFLGCKLKKYYTPNMNRIQSDSWDNDSKSFYLILRGVIASYFVSSQTLDILTTETSRCLTVPKDMYNTNTNLWFRRIIEFLKDNSDAYFDFSNAPDTLLSIGTGNTWAVPFGTPAPSGYPDISINLSRVIAYQLAYFHYMTNDKVDYIYSSDLYRNMMKGFIYDANSPSNDLLNDVFRFNYNGLSYDYDVFSEHFMRFMLTFNFPDIANSDLENPNSSSNAKYYFWNELMSIRKSLKYGDYFTGSRPHPLAVGDVNSPVVGGSVSSLDITRNLLMQRFLNAVNKTGRKISEYMKEIRGVNIMPDNDSPKFLSRDTVNLGQQEVENTGTEQGKLVGVLRAQQSKFVFEAEISEPSIILGVCSFDIPRFYSQTIDRQFFIRDRYDMFQPYMQNIGDQEIFAAEKQLGGDVPFAFTLRHMEYKQRFDIVSGGFVKDLPDLLFVADSETGEDRLYTELSPEFIRSHNVELDRFFSVLEGDTPSEYYHFRIKFENMSSPNRNMEYSPTIL